MFVKKCRFCYVYVCCGNVSLFDAVVFIRAVRGPGRNGFEIRIPAKKDEYGKLPVGIMPVERGLAVYEKVPRIVLLSV